MKIYIKKTVSSNFELLETPDQALGKGGQARVFKIQTKGYDDFCLKKFIREEDAKKNYDRIVYMIQNPPQNIMGSKSFRICWPTAFAYDSQKNFIGYIMPLAFPESRDLKILEVYSPKPISQQARYKKYPDWFDKYEIDTDEGLKNRMKMLCNWAIAIYSIHATHKYVIIDLKPENVLATSSGKISIVDTDSFQISENGRILFPGTAFTPGYFPPEGKNIKKNKAPFPISCDCFAAAVCFYKILVGVHPFGGMIKKAPYNQIETEEDAINAGLFAFGDKKQFLDFPAFNLHKHFENFPLAIQHLFKRAFGSNINARPTMDEWGKTLHEAIVSNSVSVRTVIKPTHSNSFSIQIIEVKFADVDYNGSIIRYYGNKLYSDVSYLSPQITYKSLKNNSNLEIGYKIYSPSGQLEYNSSIKSGFTSLTHINCTSNSIQTVILPGWGNKNKTAYTETGIWRMEIYEGDKCLYKASIEIHPIVASQSSYIPSATPQTPPSWMSSPKQVAKKKSKWWAWMLLFISIIWLGYQFWYKDYAKDNAAPHSYVFATNLFLRSSKEANTDNNLLGTMPYGTELVTYSDDGEWAYVKANGQKGYVASDYLLSTEDFALLNGVWGNEEAKEMVETSKYRLAVLDYLKSNHLQTGSTGWQLYAKQKEMKPNSVLYPLLNNGKSKDTGFAFILKDNATGKRKLILYAFEENDIPVFRYAEDAPERGDITSVVYSRWNDKYRITYSKKNTTYTPPIQQQTKQEPKPFIIHSVEFANTDYDGNVLTGFGKQLYTDVQYLKPRIAYKKQAPASESLTFKVKILRPDGTLERGTSSPAGYTFEHTVNVWGQSGTCELTGWGNREGNAYQAGRYHYEIWHEEEMLYSTTVDIKKKEAVAPLSISSVAFANVNYNEYILRNYGSQLYSDTQYLRAKVSYRKPTASTESFKLKVKIFNPDGSLNRGSVSPAGYTFETQLLLSGKEGSFLLTGWGNKEGTVYTAGNYRYEIWLNGTKLLYATMVNIKDKP